MLMLVMILMILCDIIVDGNATAAVTAAADADDDGIMIGSSKLTNTVSLFY